MAITGLKPAAKKFLVEEWRRRGRGRRPYYKIIKVVREGKFQVGSTFQQMTIEYTI